MRYSKKYIIMALLMFLALALKFSNVGAKSEEIEEFRGARLEQEIWNPMIAGTVNDKLLSVLVDNKELTSVKDGIYMDDNLNIMVPVSSLGESFNCGSHIYNEKELVLEKRSDMVSFTLDQPYVKVNDQEEAVQSPMIGKNGNYYVPIQTVAEKLNFKKWLNN